MVRLDKNDGVLNGASLVFPKDLYGREGCLSRVLFLYVFCRKESRGHCCTFLVLKMLLLLLLLEDS